MKTSEQNQQFNKLFADFDRQKQCMTELHGALHIGFFDCEKLLVPGVTLHLRLFRFPNNTMLFMKGTDDEAKALAGKVQAIFEKASFFCYESSGYGQCGIVDREGSRKERKFHHTNGSKLFCEKNVFGTEPFRRLTLCMVKNSLFRYTALIFSPF